MLRENQKFGVGYMMMMRYIDFSAAAQESKENDIEVFFMSVIRVGVNMSI